MLVPTIIKLSMIILSFSSIYAQVQMPRLTCPEDREIILDQIKESENTDSPITDLTPPECTEDGKYQTVQHTQFGVECWDTETGEILDDQSYRVVLDRCGYHDVVLL